jgi:sortase (surface protein transpeptidase)
MFLLDHHASLPRVLAAASLGLAAAATAVDGERPAPAPPPSHSLRVALEPDVRVDRHAARPVRIRIPSIGVDTRLVALGRDASGALEVPSRFDLAGWYTGAPRPGEVGPAVIAGHVDSVSGPAVFYRLGSLRGGAAIRIARHDGSTVTFRVQRIERWPKDRFPTRRVYGPTRRATLRLVTCGGTFDAGSGHYRDNTIVFAVRRAIG